MKITKPKKADGAKLNTWIVDVDGFENLGTKLLPSKKLFAVRFTSDYHETLSITDEANNIQFLVPFEKVEELIRCARKAKKKS